jgi:ribosome-binding factor A
MKNRLVRVCEVLKREIGVIIRRELEFENTLVTVSDVDITPDLKQAHIFISALGSPAGRRKAMEALENHRVMFQTELSRRVHMKHTPHLNFRLDEAIFYTDSYTDLPLLLAVAEPVVVNPDPRLRREARLRGWPVLRW